MYNLCLDTDWLGTIHKGEGVGELALTGSLINNIKGLQDLKYGDILVKHGGSW